MSIRNSSLLTPYKIGNLTLPNRFIRSATFEGISTRDGFPTQKLLDLTNDLAEGEVGLIIPGVAYTSDAGQAFFGETGMACHAHSRAWVNTVEDVHKKGSKIMFQLCHGGPKCKPEVLNGELPFGPSDIPNKTRELSLQAIDDTIQSFIDAAIRVQGINADGVQLHASHGFLLSSFLSPAFNRRNDKWGGCVDNRLRIVKTIVHEIKKVTSPNFAVSMKINGSDCIEGGVTPFLAAEYVYKLPHVDMFEISCGVGPKSFTSRAIIDQNVINNNFQGNNDRAKMALQTAKQLFEGVPYSEAYNLTYARLIHEKVPKANLAVVGGIRSFTGMQDIIDSGVCNFVALSRPFLREPHLVKDFREGKIEKVGCISCGLCSLRRSDGVRCYYPKK